MRQAIAKFLAAAGLCFALCGSAACGDNAAYEVYAPDGAPALSLAYAIAQDDAAFEYHVVNAAVIQAHVTGDRPAADFCVLPVNLASKLLGTGTEYRLLGTVTNGNLFFLSAEENESLTRDNLTSLTGKKIGVVQLTNVPGLTLCAVLKDYGIDYQILSGVDGEIGAGKVGLVNLGTDASAVSPAFGCDYYLCPEPAASAKIKGTAGKPKSFHFAGDLQRLYGEGNGYPQAVLVAKKSVVERDKAAVERLVSYFQKSAEYLADTPTETVLDLLAAKRTAGMTPSFHAENLTPAVIANCSVRFIQSPECKSYVNRFLEEIVSVNADAASAVSDEFFYQGE